MNWIKDFDDADVAVTPEKLVKWGDSEQHFQICVAPLKNTYPKVELDKWEVDYLDERIDKIIKKKMTEPHHQKDPIKEEKRWRTGLYGEAAVCKFLGLDFTEVLDLSVRCSQEFSSDLSQAGYAVGVKSVCWGNYPLMYPNRQGSSPEVIVFRETSNDREMFYIAGLSSPNDLTDPNNFRIEFVRTHAARDKGKSAFIAMDKLQPLTIQSIYPYRIVF